ncbi:ATP-dependent DNA helicase [Trichonephila clavipes]|nr:ATP-dependent DNA helicase [Trichonephila clavipes]
MEIYNRYTDNDGYCNTYMTCASTGEAVVAISGTTVHTALKISLSRLLPLNSETAQQYRTLFKYIKVIIIDEISMISAQLLLKVYSRLKQITGNFLSNFGGLDIILIGDLRQLSPVRSTPIYKQPKQTIVGPILWQNLKFYELNEVMRQANQQFSSILTKIGNGEQLDKMEITLSLVFVLWKKLKQDVLKGKKLRRKAAGYAAEIGVSGMTVPIVLRSSNIPLNNNKPIFVKRTHVPLVCACATTIHKSQGNTYSEIVYEYDRRPSQSLLYFVLSRVTSIEGLSITTKNNDKTFYHCRRRSSSAIDLQEEFKRLSLNKLQKLSMKI